MTVKTKAKIRIAGIMANGSEVYLAGSIWGCEVAAKIGTGKQMIRALRKPLRALTKYVPIPGDPRQLVRVRFEIVNSDRTYTFDVNKIPSEKEWEEIEAKHL